MKNVQKSELIPDRVTRDPASRPPRRFTTPGGASKGAPIVLAAIALLFALLAFRSSGYAQTASTLYSFDCTNGWHDGCYPQEGVIEKDGVLYGTTQSGGDGSGTAFALTQPATPGAPWNQTVIYRFSNGIPSSLVAGPGHTFYGGTTNFGSRSSGTVFELQPQSEVGSPWALTVLSYPAMGCGSEGMNYCNGPSGLIVDSKGTLYGVVEVTSNGFGEVFSLTPPTTPGGPWTENVLHLFTGSRKDGGLPNSFLLLGPNGVIYGTCPPAAITTRVSFSCSFRRLLRAAPGTRSFCMYSPAISMVHIHCRIWSPTKTADSSALLRISSVKILMARFTN